MGKDRIPPELRNDVRSEENFKIKIEEDTFWKEVGQEDIEGNIHCPRCGTILIIVPSLYPSLAYCPGCRKYYELMKRCGICGMEYNVSKIHFCNSYLPNKVQ